MPRRSETDNIESGILSTYNCASFCNVAPITFRTWCDEGKVTGAYKPPGSKEYKVPAPDLLTFMRVSNMPVPKKLLDAVTNYNRIYNDDGSQRMNHQAR